MAVFAPDSLPGNSLIIWPDIGGIVFYREHSGPVQIGYIARGAIRGSDPVIKCFCVLQHFLTRLF